MCLIAFAFDADPRYRLVLAANRDEFRQRQTARAQWWPDQPELLAGRDLLAGGTWLGISRSGTIAALTNIRNPKAPKSGAHSRGELVVDAVLHRPSAHQDAYAGYNLLVGEPMRDIMRIEGNRPGQLPVPLHPGLYGLSNGSLDDPWPKTVAVKAGLRAQLQDADATPFELASSLFDLLSQSDPYPDQSLPNTGVDAALERSLSPLFIDMPEYGTRSSSVVLIERSGKCHFFERSHDGTSSQDVALSFQIDASSRP